MYYIVFLFSFLYIWSSIWQGKKGPDKFYFLLMKYSKTAKWLFLLVFNFRFTDGEEVSFTSTPKKRDWPGFFLFTFDIFFFLFSEDSAKWKWEKRTTYMEWRAFRHSKMEMRKEDNKYGRKWENIRSEKRKYGME